VASQWRSGCERFGVRAPSGTRIFEFVWDAQKITWGWWLSRPSDETINRVQCVYAFRTSSTHYKDPAVSVRKSQDCGNIQKPAYTKVLKRENGRMRLEAAPDQSNPRMWHLLRAGQNIGQAPWAFDSMDMCAIKKSVLIIIRQDL
jgi:hypothetical protein